MKIRIKTKLIVVIDVKEIDLKTYNIRTDLVMDLIKDKKVLDKFEYKEGKTSVSKITLNKEEAAEINKKEGKYTTIYFDDVTDNTNYLEVKEVFKKEFKEIILNEGIKEDDTILFIGLGNSKSTPDSLGSRVINGVVVTKHIYDLVGSLEDGFMKTSAIAPGVMGTTGIETSNIISGIIEKEKPNFLVVIDSLASDSIDRVLKTIQITNTGITPGSGIGNERKEISKEIFNLPTIAIGVPAVVDAVTIVSDTINYMKKHFSYNLRNKDMLHEKLIPSFTKNYLKQDNLFLNKEEETYLLGALGNLTEFEQKALIFDVLTPIGYNLMVTPKEVDFQIEKLAKLLSEGINEVIHEQKVT